MTNCNFPNNKLNQQHGILQTQRGFSLIELMVVVVILSIFAGLLSLSVGGSEARKNRAYYEHLLDSLQYIRLLSAERMQPMGIRLTADKQGNLVTQAVTLQNAYQHYQVDVERLDARSSNADTSASVNNTDTAKNNMELSVALDDDEAEKPTWVVDEKVTLPELPDGIDINIAALDTVSDVNNRERQPWFDNQQAPQLMWFGTGQATPFNIEVLHKGKLVADTIRIMPDGSVTVEGSN